MKVVSIAVEKYFVDGIPVRKTIENHKEIFDFCISQKVGKQFKVEHHYIKDNKQVKQPVQRLNRFFISKTGGSLVKIKEDGSTSRLAAGNSITLYNKVYKSKKHDIKYDYYVAEANKLINAVDSGQMQLF